MLLPGKADVLFIGFGKVLSSTRLRYIVNIAVFEESLDEQPNCDSWPVHKLSDISIAVKYGEK